MHWQDTIHIHVRWGTSSSLKKETLEVEAVPSQLWQHEELVSDKLADFFSFQ